MELKTLINHTNSVPGIIELKTLINHTNYFKSDHKLKLKRLQYKIYAKTLLLPIILHKTKYLYTRRQNYKNIRTMSQ